MKAYQAVTDRVLALLEQGTVPWRQPWRTVTTQDGLEFRAANLASKRPYSGTNAWLLPALGYPSPWWVTYNQARELGGHVREGEKASPVVYWNWSDSKERDKNGKPKRVAFLRYYSVFNLLQTDGLAAPEVENAPVPPAPIESAEALVRGYQDPPAIEECHAAALYSAKRDVVAMPPRGTFESMEAFYSVLFHELGHSTGAKHRLARESLLKYGTERPREELVAEFCATFLCSRAGIDPRLEQSAAYIASWARELRADTKCFVLAAGAAAKACDWILGTRDSAQLAA